jgi:hypothetical protein
MVLYANDADDLLPFASAPWVEAGMWRFNAQVRVPQGWDNSSLAQSHKATDALAWINSSRPYYKSNDALSAPDVPVIPALGEIGAELEPPAIVGFTFNGLLHIFSLSSVYEPENVPLLWQGNGLVNIRGGAMSNPVMSCFGPGVCRYGVSENTPGTMFLFRGGTVSPGSKFLFLSTGLKLTERRLNQGKDLNTNRTDPFQSYNDGVPATVWSCRGYSGAQYPCLFRPDLTSDDF